MRHQKVLRCGVTLPGDAASYSIWGKNERRPIMASIKPKLKYHLIWTCVDGTTPVPSQA